MLSTSNHDTWTLPCSVCHRCGAKSDLWWTDMISHLEVNRMTRSKALPWLLGIFSIYFQNIFSTKKHGRLSMYCGGFITYSCTEETLYCNDDGVTECKKKHVPCFATAYVIDCGVDMTKGKWKFVHTHSACTFLHSSLWTQVGKHTCQHDTHIHPPQAVGLALGVCCSGVVSYMCVCIYIYVYVCMHVCMHACMYIVM